MRHLDRLHTPLVLTYGTYETPEFQRQTRDFAAAVKAAGKPVELLVGEGYNHFEMLETLANPYGAARPRGAGADEIDAGISCPKARRAGGSGSFDARCLARGRADQFGAAVAAGIDGVFDVGGERAAAMVDHAAGASRAGHHQGRQTRGRCGHRMAH